MKKVVLGWLGSLLFCCNSYAQIDTVPPPVTDTLITDSIKIPLPDTLNVALAGTPVSITTQPIYRLKPAVDIPIVAVGAGWSLYAFSKIYSKDKSSEEAILALDRDNVNWFDRWAIRPYSKDIDNISYIPFFASMPLPLLFAIDKKTRKDFFKLNFLYLEAMSITGFFYTGSVYLFDRYRPYAYSEESTMDQRRRGGAKNSFYAGHVALVATSTFFMSKVYADYYPDSKIRWVFYTIASVTTATTAYLRHRHGQHFPSDLLLGVGQGVLTGILVPHFHKNRSLKKTNLSVLPFTGKTHGVAMLYRF